MIQTPPDRPVQVRAPRPEVQRVRPPPPTIMQPDERDIRPPIPMLHATPESVSVII